jgi:hypothetical protein
VAKKCGLTLLLRALLLYRLNFNPLLNRAVPRQGKAMQALFVAWYNFGRKHEALKGTSPAMARKLTDHIWTIKELIEPAAI